MEEPPGHGAHLIKKHQGLLGQFPVDGTGRDDQLQVAVDLFGRAVGDPPQVRAVATGTTVAFGEVRRNRARRENQLVSDRFERSGHPDCEPEGDAGCLDGDAVDGET